MHEFGFWGAKRVDFALEGVRSVGFEVDSVVVISPRWRETFCLFFGKYLPMSFVFFWEVVGGEFFACVMRLDRPFLCEMGGAYPHDELIPFLQPPVIFECIPPNGCFHLQSFRCFLFERSIGG